MIHLTDRIELSVLGWLVRLVIACCTGSLATGLWLRLRHGTHKAPSSPLPRITLRSAETMNKLARQCRQPESDR